MLKRFRWLILGYILKVFTFDILKRTLAARYSGNRTYNTIMDTVDSVTDFNKNKKSFDIYVEEN